MGAERTYVEVRMRNREEQDKRYEVGGNARMTRAAYFLDC